jgi:hypothetical protein
LILVKNRMVQVDATKADIRVEIVLAIFGFNADHNRKSRE